MIKITIIFKNQYPRSTPTTNSASYTWKTLNEEFLRDVKKVLAKTRMKEVSYFLAECSYGILANHSDKKLLLETLTTIVRGPY